MSFNDKEPQVIDIMPRFKLLSSLKKDEVINTVVDGVNTDNTVNGKTIHDHFYLTIPERDWHYWSPELHITVEELNEQSLIRCHVGPRQTVWVMILFLYASISLLVLFGGMYALTQWQMSRPTMWLWVIPVGILALAGVYIIAKIGQYKGRDQMLHLCSFLYHTLSAKGDLERYEGDAHLY